MCIRDSVNNGRAAAFLHTPAGFVLQRGDAALLVARAWVFVHGFSAVSYTHLDVYKRQTVCRGVIGGLSSVGQSIRLITISIWYRSF